MSKKSVPFSVPAKPASAKLPAADILIDAHSDDWVNDRNGGTDRPAETTAPSLVLDLSAERSLMEVVALSMLAPFALGWFWLMHAMAGRVRFWSQTGSRAAGQVSRSTASCGRPRGR